MVSNDQRIELFPRESALFFDKSTPWTNHDASRTSHDGVRTSHDASPPTHDGLVMQQASRCYAIPPAHQPVPGEPLLDYGHCVLRLDAVKAAG